MYSNGWTWYSLQGCGLCCERPLLRHLTRYLPCRMGHAPCRVRLSSHRSIDVKNEVQKVLADWHADRHSADVNAHTKPLRCSAAVPLSWPALTPQLLVSSSQPMAHLRVRNVRAVKERVHIRCWQQWWTSGGYRGLPPLASLRWRSTYFMTRSLIWSRLLLVRNCIENRNGNAARRFLRAPMLHSRRGSRLGGSTRLMHPAQAQHT